LWVFLLFISEYCLLTHSSIEDVSDELLDWLQELLESGLCIEVIILILSLLFTNVALFILVDWLKKNSVKNNDKTGKKTIHLAAIQFINPFETSGGLEYIDRCYTAIIDLNDPSGSNLEDFFRDNPMYIKVEVRHPDLEGRIYKGLSRGILGFPDNDRITEIANSQGPWNANEIRDLWELGSVHYQAGISLDKIRLSLNNQTDYILQTGYPWSPVPVEISFNNRYFFKTLTIMKIYKTYISEARFI
jgi:hypothetical protein